jgi:hypothetical protein
MGRRIYWPAVIVALIASAAWGLVAWQSIGCSDAGGTFVRGVIWFECIQ